MLGVHQMKKWKCLICGQYQRKDRRKGKDYCSQPCYEQSKKRFCKSCQKEFVADPKCRRYCHECLENGQSNRHYYSQHKIKLVCQNCGDYFKDTSQHKLCGPCKQKLPNPLIHTYDDVERNILCKQCGCVINTEIVKNSYRTKPIKRRGYCDDCIIKRSMTRNNQQTNKVCKRCDVIFKCHGLKQFCETCRVHNRDQQSKWIPVPEHVKVQNRKRMSDRMKKHNPMFRKDVRNKVSKTIKDRIANGDTVYPTGKEHGSWKGNRTFNFTCRSRLYKPWIFRVLERDNFTCTICGYTGQLHVHHIRPLRDIIDLVLSRHNIQSIKDMDSNSELYHKLIDEVVSCHVLADGITLCAKCHTIIDDRYRRKHEDCEDN